MNTITGNHIRLCTLNVQCTILVYTVRTSHFSGSRMTDMFRVVYLAAHMLPIKLWTKSDHLL